MHFAANEGHTEAITTLLEAGANPNQHTDGGYTALHIVAMGDHDVKAISALLDAGADPNQRTNGGLTPLELIKETSLIYKIDIWWRLFDASSN